MGPLGGCPRSSKLGVEGSPQALPCRCQSEADEEGRAEGSEEEVWSPVEVGHGIVEHGSPFRARRLDANAEEGEGPDAEDNVRVPHHGEHGHLREEVRKEVAEVDTHRSSADGSGPRLEQVAHREEGLEVLLAVEAESARAPHQLHEPVATLPNPDSVDGEPRAGRELADAHQVGHGTILVLLTIPVQTLDNTPGVCL